MLSRHNEFPQPLLIRSNCLIGTFLPGWGLCQRRSLAAPGSRGLKPPVPSAGRAAQGRGRSGDGQGGQEGWGHPCHLALVTSLSLGRVPMPVSPPLTLPVSQIHPSSGTRDARSPVVGLGMPAAGGTVGLQMPRVGVMLARAPVCVVPNLPLQIKGAATHAAALSSHITHTTSMLHCDNGV